LFPLCIATCRPVARGRIAKHVSMEVDSWKLTRYGTHFRLYEWSTDISLDTDKQYRVIQEELTMTELISDDFLSKKCHINLGPILSIYRVTFLFGFFSKFQF
jgi:hypothetical protein